MDRMSHEERRKRYENIIALYKTMKNKAKIGRMFGISRERVRQIVNMGISKPNKT